jgi:hypothetical protein
LLSTVSIQSTPEVDGYGKRGCIGDEREKGRLISLHILMAKLRALKQTTRGYSGGSFKTTEGM